MGGLLVLGAGGHAKVVADILTMAGCSVRGFLDDDQAIWGQTRLGLPVLAALAAYAQFTPDGLVVGIGTNQIRQRVVARLGSSTTALWRNAIHPQAIIARSVRSGSGVVIGAGAIVNPDSLLGDHVIINTGASVDHDCTIGDYTHIAPGVHLAGGVHVGRGVLIGIGASVAPLCTIGDFAVIGAGATVVCDIPAGVVAKGVPARWNITAVTRI